MKNIMHNDLFWLSELLQYINTQNEKRRKSDNVCTSSTSVNRSLAVMGTERDVYIFFLGDFFFFLPLGLSL
jgi:quinolinate synthase